MFSRRLSLWNSLASATLIAGVVLFVVGIVGAQSAWAETFFVSPEFDHAERGSITASQRAVNDVLRVFVEDAWWEGLTTAQQSSAMTTLNDILEEMQRAIYPRLRSFFGAEASPGIDGDPRVIVLFSHLEDGAGGYFRETDQVSRQRASQSNERDMVHLNANNLLSSSLLSSYMAHEFQHLITWNQKNLERGLREEVWINEGRSEYAPTLLGHDTDWFGTNLQARVQAYLGNPEESLLEWNGQDHDYGHVNLFMQYLADQFGDNIVARTMESGVGIASVNNALVKTGSSRVFSDIFTDWAIANYLNTSDNRRWGYQHDRLSSVRVSPTREFVVRATGQITWNGTIQDWSAQWLRFSSGGTSSAPNVTFRFVRDDTTAVFRVSYIIERMNGMASVDEMDVSSGTQAVVSLSDFGTDVRAVTFIPTVQTLLAYPGAQEAPHASFSITAERSAASALSIDAVTPSVVATDGGAKVFVRGSGFTDDLFVVVDGVLIVPSVASDRVLSFTVQPHSAGVVDVALRRRSDGLEVRLADALTYQGAPPAEEEPLPVDDKDPALFDGLVDGDLIRAEGDIDVYIVKFVTTPAREVKRFKRLIINPDVFNSYGHLRWQDIKTVVPAVRDALATSTIVRAAGDPRVWQLFPEGDEGEKRWLNITAAQFTASGRDWDSIYMINAFERVLYGEGETITQ